MEWNLDGEVLDFFSRDSVGDSETEPSTVAYLVARTPDGSLWNWTSVVFYTPDAGIRGSVPILCGGGGASDCTRDIIVVGRL